MEPQEFIDKFYLALLDKGWTLNEIDSMDMIYYLKLLTRKLGEEKVYIDDILWYLDFTFTLKRVVIIA